MIDTLVGFYAKSADKAPRDPDDPEVKKEVRRRKWQLFFAITFGYGFYYVCRLSFNVARKPMADADVLNVDQIGVVGSALLFAYAFGKFTNGVICDYVNQRRFMATGLFVSGLANVLFSLSATYWLFIALWAVNGWFQSFGAASSVVSISRWYEGKERGSYYGAWASSHNIGEAITYVGTAVIIGVMGWAWGIRAAGIFGLLGSIYILWHVHERPGVHGLPGPKRIDSRQPKRPIWELQLEVVKNPAVWILAASSAAFYVTRYAIKGWGIFFLEAERGYSTEQASFIIAVNAIAGILGTFFSGILSDRLFARRRNVPALIFGVIYSFSTWLFLFGPANLYVEIAAMVLFGISLGALMVYIGGLMAVDICSKEVSGAALGVVGVASYIGAGVQDIISGRLLEDAKVVVDGVDVYNFDAAATMWIASSVVSIVLALFVWNAKSPDD